MLESPLTPAHLEAHRVALTGHCYRMLGSVSEAEDAVQETLVRAWRSLDRFEGRSSVRSWLYRIATRVCLDALGDRSRRARPMDLGPACEVDGPMTPALLGAALPTSAWVEPIPDARALPVEGNPAELLTLRQSTRLAFVAALQHLAPLQRAVLLLREVLGWTATEVAESLDTTVAAVNSALQRARATLASRGLARDDALVSAPLSATQTTLLRRYVDAFERYDLDALTSLLHEDATLSMPPYPLWLTRHDRIRGWLLGPGAVCRGSRLVPTWANGAPAFGQYHPVLDDEGRSTGRYAPWSLIVLDIDGETIRGMCHFLDTAAYFPLFGLPAELSA